ncbi:MAG: Na/Pi symporter [Deltaproteobacteria bacterium]|nr:Na/Pi symporter [Deltaproteobacteria bacterium]
MKMLNSWANGASKLFSVLFLLFIFLLAIQLLGDCFHLLGNDFSVELVKTTSDPFVGLFVGILSTVLVQSSSVTTSVIVGLVSGGALSVHNAVPLIMGANIGTTITSALVSLGHISRQKEFEKAFAGATMHDFFNLITVLILFPIELMTGFLAKTASYLSGFLYGFETSHQFESPIKIIIKPAAKFIKHSLLDLTGDPKLTGIFIFFLTLVGIFASLFFLVKILKSTLVQKIKIFVDRVFSSSGMLTMLIGIIITVMVQSSSITTSFMVPLIATGILSLEHAFPLTLGANVGTTVTALMAALVGNIAGLTIALVHLLFNVVGILIIYPIPKIRRIPIWCAITLAKVAVQRRVFALVYIFVVFVFIPLAFILVSRFMK